MFTLRIPAPTPHLRGCTPRRWMSVRPLVKETTPTGPGSLPTARKKVTIQSLHKQRAAGVPITVMTAYDFPTARACDTHGVDITLVGDSLAQVCLGYDSTTRLTLAEMVHHCRAVARGTAAPFLVADMPFGSYFAGPKEAMAAAVRVLQEGHAEGVKIEGGLEIVDSVRALTRVGIPVMAHVGLMPQRHTALSGYRVQGRTAQGAKEILQAALALEDAGAFSMVLEAIPHELGAYITSRLKIPTIGIGAGPATSGQVLVFDDVMATWLGHKAKFVRRFADVKGEVEKGITGYVDAVRDGSFPSVSEESYQMDPEQFKQFLEMEGDQSWVPPPSKTE